MPAAQLDLALEQGATYRRQFTLATAGPLDATGKPTAGPPYDVTGCIARMQIREKIDSPDVLVELTSDNGGLTLGGGAGTILMHISDEATENVTVRRGVYDLELEFPSGDVRRLLAGKVTFDPNVTRVTA